MTLLSMSNTPNKITKKFQDQVNNLISEGIVANQQAIVDALGWNKSQMSQAMNGAKNIPLVVYQKFTDKYGLADPVGDIEYKEKYLSSLEDRVESQKRQLNLVTKELGRVAIQNQALLHTVLAAVTELLERGSKEKIESIENRLNKATTSFLKEYQKKGSLIDLDI
jgi:DNA-binding transcriptional regulator GbsR (MarR family)